MTTPRDPLALKLQSPSETATLPPSAVDADSPTIPPAVSGDPATLPPPAPSEGETLIPRSLSVTAPGCPTIPGYEILRELGRGGMGVVYQARHRKLNRLVALKMILAGSHAGEADLARFQTEAEAIARLQHPNIVQVHEVGEHEGKPFFSLEFCAGGSLEKKLNGTPLPAREAAALVETLAQAMQAAHEQHVIHRDLKPANVLLAEDGTPKITDFGLAKKLDEAGQTQSGAIMGTPSYMAPEQAGGKSKEIGPHTDVYALGAILYEMLTGRPPFRAATSLDTILQVVSDEPVPPRQLQPKTPRDLETICLKCLQKEPHKRYVSAQALAKDLRRFQNGESVQARPVGRVKRGYRWCRWNPLGAALLAALLLGTALATGLAVWALGERSRAALEKEEKDRQLTRAEWTLYGSQLALAEAAWNDNQADLAWDYLNRTRQDYRGWEYRYLSTQFLKDQRVLKGHTAGVFAETFSPDGKHLVSAANDGTMRLWEANTGQEVRALKGHTKQVSAHGGYYANNSSDRGWVLFTIDVAFSPDGKRLAAGLSRTVHVWSADTGQEVRVLQGHTGRVTAVAFSPDGKRIASASEDKTVRLWDAETGGTIRTFLNGSHGAHYDRRGVQPRRTAALAERLAGQDGAAVGRGDGAGGPPPPGAYQLS